MGAGGGRSAPAAPAGLGTTRTRPRAPGPQGGPRGAPYVRRASGDAAGTPGPPPRSAGRAVPAGSQRPKRAASRRSNFFPGRVWTYSRGEMPRVFSKSATPVVGGARGSRWLWVLARGTLLKCPRPRVCAPAPLQRPEPPAPFWRTPCGCLCWCAGSHALRSGPKFGVCCAACAPAERGWGPLRATRSFGQVQKHGVLKPQGMGRSRRA